MFSNCTLSNGGKGQEEFLRISLFKMRWSFITFDCKLPSSYIRKLASRILASRIIKVSIISEVLHVWAYAVARLARQTFCNNTIANPNVIFTKSLRLALGLTTYFHHNKSLLTTKAFSDCFNYTTERPWPFQVWLKFKIIMTKEVKIFVFNYRSYKFYSCRAT